MNGTSMATNAARVQPGSFLTLHYRLAGPAGDIINTFGDKPAPVSNVGRYGIWRLYNVSGPPKQATYMP